MSSLRRNHDLHSIGGSDSSLSYERIRPLFIPGITGRARCLSSSDTILETYSQGSSKSSRCSREEFIMEVDRKTSSSDHHSSRMHRQRVHLKSGMSARRSTISEDLKATRKDAVEVRVKALRIKERVLETRMHDV